LETELKRPFLAYLCMIIGLIVVYLVMFCSEILINHPRFIYSIIKACKTGASTNLIYGLSFGYFSNVIPIVTYASILFLAYFWLGAFGVGLISIGIATLIPNFLGVSIFISVTEISSMIGVVNKMH
jgi:Na+/H+-translocating membrane pyrophosphatase